MHRVRFLRSGYPRLPLAPDPPAPRTDDAVRETIAVAVSAVVLAALVAAVVLGVPLFVTNDGPQGTFQAYVEAHHGDPSSIVARQLDLGVGLGGRGHQLVYRAIAAVVPFPRAYAATQIVHALSVAGGTFALARAVAGRTTPLALAGFALAFGWSFFMGFFPFVVGLGGGLFVVALAVASPRPMLLRRVAVSALLALDLVLGHPVAAATAFVVVAAVVVSRAQAEEDPEERPDRQRDAWTWMGLTALPFVVVAILLATAGREMAEVKESSQLAWPTFREWIAATPKLAAPGIGVFGWGFVALAAFALLRALRRPDATTRALAGVGLLFLAVALFGPLDAPGWQYLAPRFFVPAFALAIAVTAAHVPRVAGWVAAVAVSALALFGARRASTHYASACHDAIDGLFQPIPRRGMQLPILFDSMCGLPTDASANVVPHLQPALHLHALFAVHHGGSVPFVFAGPPMVHLLTARNPPPAPVPPLELWGLAKDGPITGDAKVRARAVDELLGYGLSYENVLFFGATDRDEAQLRARGYATDVRRGSFLSARGASCAVDVVVPVRPKDPPVMVAGGLSGPAWPAEYARRGDELHATFRGLCGDVVALVRWAAEGPRCANAPPPGAEGGATELRVVATPGQTTVVRCERGDAVAPAPLPAP